MELSLALAADERRRRRRVEERLAAAGLLRGPHRLLAGEGGVPEDRVAWAEGLAAALADLGPAFAGFGRYLGHRRDLLTARQCRVLARCETPADVGTGETVEQVLERELGAPPRELFARFAARPVARTPLVQVHRARRGDGTPLRVRLIRPGVAELLERDSPALNLLQRAWPGRRQELEELTADYRRHLDAWLDGDAQARSLAELAVSEVGADLYRVPRVDARRSAGRVLTVERPPAEPVAAAGGTPTEASALARRLCLWWLELALGGGRFPLQAEVMVLADGRLCPLAGCFPALGGARGRELAGYLRAMALGDPDRACEHLARAAGVADGPPAELRRRMRQGVPLRDGGAGDLLERRLFLAWRDLRRCGVEPPWEVDAFHRGLSWVTELAHRAEDGRAEDSRAHDSADPLRDAVQDLRWRDAWTELAGLAEPGRLLASLESYAEAASLLPQGLERALDGGDEMLRARPVEPAAPAARYRPTGVALVLAMLAVALATPPLTAALPAGAGGWAEVAGGILFAALAVGLLLPRGGRR